MALSVLGVVTGVPMGKAAKGVLRAQLDSN